MHKKFLNLYYNQPKKYDKIVASNDAITEKYCDTFQF